MKTVIIGGSAHSTPALFDTPYSLDSPQFSFELVGRSAVHLSAVSRAIDVIAASRGASVDCRAAIAGSTDCAIADADVIIIQFRVGGYSGRAFDETFPHRFGLCGDEGLGVGGLAAAWRTWEELQRTLNTVARVNPDALILLLTSPVSILTRCARNVFPSLRLFGICELPWTTLNELCNAAGIEVRNASYAYIAVNHIGWFSNLTSLETGKLASKEVNPLKYVRLQTSPADVLAEQRISRARASELADLAAEAFSIYENGSAPNILAAVRRRRTPWYASAVAPFLRSLASEDTGVTFFLSAANEGYCSLFRSDDVIEMPFTLKNGILESVKTIAWQHDDIAVKLKRLITYERVAAEAVISRDVRKIAVALRAHPWLDGMSVSDELVADVVASGDAARTTSFR